MNNSCDASLVALKQSYDQYGLCAGRLYELQRWITTNKGIDK